MSEMLHTSMLHLSSSRTLSSAPISFQVVSGTVANPSRLADGSTSVNALLKSSIVTRIFSKSVSFNCCDDFNQVSTEIICNFEIYIESNLATKAQATVEIKYIEGLLFILSTENSAHF